MDQFEEQLDEATAAQTVPGASVAAVDKTGGIIYSYNSGRHSVLENAPLVTPDSIFEIQSCTKIITAIAALQCVDRGLIGLDDPVSQHLPELHAQDIISMQPVDPQNPAQRPPEIGGVDPTAVTLTYAPAAKEITLRHLLTHTSGSGTDGLDPLRVWRRLQGSEGALLLRGDILAGATMPRVHEPGASWSYGQSYDWASLLVGRLNGTTFGRYLEENVFRPLGMRDCTFHLEERPDVRARLVEMSVREEDRRLVPGKHQMWDPVKDETGGGGMYSSSVDFAKVLADLIRDEPVLLKRDTIELLFSPQLEPGGAAHQAFMKYDPWFKSYMPSPPRTMNHSVGGLLVMEDDPIAGVPQGTLSWCGSSGPMWAANRAKGVAWYYATQVPYGDVESGKLCQEFSRLVFAGKATVRA